jgi:hypothetical protein
MKNARQNYKRGATVLPSGTALAAVQPEFRDDAARPLPCFSRSIGAASLLPLWRERRPFLQISLRSQPASKPAQDEAESLESVESVWIVGVGRHAHQSGVHDEQGAAKSRQGVACDYS